MTGMYNQSFIKTYNLARGAATVDRAILTPLFPSTWCFDEQVSCPSARSCFHSYFLQHVEVSHKHDSETADSSLTIVKPLGPRSLRKAVHQYYPFNNTSFEPSIHHPIRPGRCRAAHA